MTNPSKSLNQTLTVSGLALLVLGIAGTALFLIPADWKPKFTVSVLCPSNIPVGQSLNLTVITAGEDDREFAREVTIQVGLDGESEFRAVHQERMSIPGVVHFDLPTSDLSMGRYLAKVNIEGIDAIERAFRVGDPLPSYDLRQQTDRARYQPGQTIHARSVLTKNGKPPDGETIAFSLVDDRGTKLFQKEIDTSRFGIASADFELASELRLGEYKLIAESPDGVMESLAITIDRYVLPPFIVDLSVEEKVMDRGHAQIEGFVAVDQPTAGPIPNCSVVVTARIFNSRLSSEEKKIGATDAKGRFGFMMELEDLPRPIKSVPREGVDFEITATVTDPMGHSEEVSKALSFPPYKEPFQVFIIPEQGVLKSGIPNRVSVICCDRNGSPVDATIHVFASGSEFEGRTSQLGVVAGEIVPKGSRCRITMTGETSKGEAFEKTKELVTAPADDQLTLRFDRPVVPQGQAITLQMNGLDESSRAILEIRSFIGNRQVFSDSIEPSGSNKDISLQTDAWPNGVVVASLWQTSGEGRTNLGEAAVFVSGESRLQTQITLASGQVLPGEKNWLFIKTEALDGMPIDGVAGVCITDIRNTRESGPGLYSWTNAFSFIAHPEIPLDRENIPEWLRNVLDPPEDRDLREVIPKDDEVALEAFLDAVASEVAPMWLEEKYDSSNPIKAWQKEIWRDLTGYCMVLLALALFMLGISWLVRMVNTEKTASTVLIESIIVGSIILFLILNAIPNFLEAQIRAAVPVEKEYSEYPSRFTVGSALAAGIPLRKHFPETLLWMPEVGLDSTGIAEIEIPPADSITDWKIEVRTHDIDGRFGAAEGSFSAQKDLAVEPDLPNYLYEGDQIEIPIRVSNHSDVSLKVEIRAEALGGIENEDDGWQRNLELAPKSSEAVYLPAMASSPTNGTLTIVAQSESISDAVQRVIRVLPSSEQREKVITRRITGQWEDKIGIPDEALPGTVHAELTLALTSTALIEKALPKLEDLIRKPYGCFEQTSSVAFPNALVLRLSKEMNWKNDAFIEQAKRLVVESYQRLLTFEVPGGGFSLYGQKPARPALSALGLMEFSEMSRVIPVDPAIIERTANYMNRILTPSEIDGTDLAYAAWAMAHVDSGKDLPKWIRTKVRESIPVETDVYRLALWVDTLRRLNPFDPMVEIGKKRLASFVKWEGDLHWWSSSGRTLMGSHGSVADVEVTALAIQSLASDGPGIDLLPGAEEWLLSRMRGDGSWGTTQANVQALKALIALTEFNQKSEPCQVSVTKGNSVERVDLDSERSEMIVPLTVGDDPDLSIGIQSDNESSIIARLRISYRAKWLEEEEMETSPLRVSLDTVAEAIPRGGTLPAKLELTWKGTEPAQTPLVTIPLPAGFRFSSSARHQLEKMDEVEKVQVTGQEVYLYLADLDVGDRVTLPINMTADLGGEFHTAPLQVSLYYQPTIRSREFWPNLLVR